MNLSWEIKNRQTHTYINSISRQKRALSCIRQPKSCHRYGNLFVLLDLHRGVPCPQKQRIKTRGRRNDKNKLFCFFLGHSHVPYKHVLPKETDRKRGKMGMLNVTKWMCSCSLYMVTRSVYRHFLRSSTESFSPVILWLLLCGRNRDMSVNISCYFFHQFRWWTVNAHLVRSRACSHALKPLPNYDFRNILKVKKVLFNKK